MFPSAFVWNINPFSGEILVFQVKLAAILKMADPPIVTHTFSPNKPDFLFIDIHWPPKPLVLEKNSHFGNPIEQLESGESGAFLSLQDTVYNQLQQVKQDIRACAIQRVARSEYFDFHSDQ